MPCILLGYLNLLWIVGVLPVDGVSIHCCGDVGIYDGDANCGHDNIYINVLSSFLRTIYRIGEGLNYKNNFNYDRNRGKMLLLDTILADKCTYLLRWPQTYAVDIDLIYHPYNYNAEM
jgi:hypothetical protein